MGEELLQEFINFCLNYLSKIKLPRKRYYHFILVVSTIILFPMSHFQVTNIQYIQFAQKVVDICRCVLCIFY